MLSESRRIGGAGGIELVASTVLIFFFDFFLDGEEDIVILGEHLHSRSMIVLFDKVGGLQVRSADMTR